MATVRPRARDIPPEELAQMNNGFERHALVHGVSAQTSRRFGFMGLAGEAFNGCATGLV